MSVGDSPFLVVHCGGLRAHTIPEILKEMGFRAYIIPFEEFSVRDVEGTSGIILSGGPRMLTEKKDSWVAKYGFLAKTQTPLLGICFGHQLLGRVFGGKSARGYYIGSVQPTLMTKDPLFKGLPPSEYFTQDHRERVSVPPGFTRIAHSITCPNEAMKHDEKMIYGVQFHPELSGERGRTILKNFCRMAQDSS